MKKKRFLSAILSAALGIACVATPFSQKAGYIAVNELTADAADEFYTTPDGYRYKIDAINRTASFTGYFSYGEELVIPPTITAVINNSYEVECTVTNFEIGSLYVASEEYSHGYITQIKKITIPGTIKNIGHYFLQDFYDDGWYSLEEIIVEEGVETLDSYAFDVRHPTKITLPSTITNIHTYAFSDSFVKDGVLYGYSGNIAESFAKYKGIPFVSLGSAPSQTSTASATTTTTTTTVTSEITTTTTAVSPTLPDLEISASAITLEEGEQYTITANQSDLTYRSNNTDVAVVSKKGVVTAIGEGTALISVINDDGDVAQLKVTVTSLAQQTTTAATTTTTRTTTTASFNDDYIAGDCNNDARFNVADLVTLQKWLLGDPDIELGNWRAANFCEDNRLDVFDICLMRRALLLSYYGY